MATIMTHEVFVQTMSLIQRGIKSTAADNTSSYSNIPVFVPHPEDLKHARNCELLYIGLSFLGLQSAQNLFIVEKLQRIAHKWKYEGSWSKVDEALNTTFTPYLQLERYLRSHTTNDWFGNDCKLLIRILRRIKVRNPYVSRPSRVVVPKRKRGYDDKGHLRDQSKTTVGKPSTELIPMRDYRDKILSQFYPDWYAGDKDQIHAGIVQAATIFPTRDYTEIVSKFISENSPSYNRRLRDHLNLQLNEGSSKK